VDYLYEKYRIKYELEEI